MEESYSIGREALINVLTHSECLNIEVESIRILVSFVCRFAMMDAATLPKSSKRVATGKQL